MTEAVYRSTAPAVLAHVEKAKAGRVEWTASINQFIAANLPADSHAMHATRMDSDHLIGFRLPDGVETPTGWRKVPRSGVYWPNENTKAGRTLAAALAPLVTIPHPLAVLPGLPGVIFAGDQMHFPGARLRGDVVWVKWGFDVEGACATRNAEDEAFEAGGPRRSSSRGQRPDPALWEHVPMPAYYVLVEAGNDPFKPED